MFRGASKLTLDAKGRMAIPARYREALHDQASNQLVITVNPSDPALWIFPLPEWEKAQVQLMELSSFQLESRRLKQLLMGYATDVTLDSHGRMLLTPELREYAGLDKQVMLVGQTHRFELWDEQAWHATFKTWREGLGKSEKLTAEIEGLNI